MDDQRRVGQGSGAGRGVRWWPLLAIALLSALALVWVWLSPAPHRQERVLRTLVVTGLGGILALVWVLAFSRMAWRARGIVLAGAVLLVVAGAALLEPRGVTGDVLPLLGWRWSATPVGAGEPAPAASARALDAGAWDPADDYPQFLGPRRDGSVPRVRLDPDWAARPPRELWRRPVGEGWGGFAVSGPWAVTLEQRGDRERVSCYERTTGELLWVVEDPLRHEDPLGGPGPRATPAIDRGRVFAYGATGLLRAIDLRSGERLWAVDVMRDNGAAPPTYGVSASPLVIGDAVVVAAGGGDGRSLVAYDAHGGARLWSGGDAAAAYSSPSLVRLAGRDQIVWLNASALVGHDPADGALLWQVGWPGGTENVSQPVVLDGERVFQSTGYGVGGKTFRLRQGEGPPRVETVWESLALKSKLSNVVLAGGHLYGLDDGILACVDAATGERVWKGGRYGHGQIILAGDDLLLIQAESGEVVLARATPRGHEELARLAALDDKTWNPPALAGRHLLIRNDREAACYELPAVERPDDRASP